MSYCIKVRNGPNEHEMPHRMKKEFCDQMMGPLILKWYLRIYIFIEYLKCVWKSNYIWTIRNDSKKKKRVMTTSSSPGSTFESGRVRRRECHNICHTLFLNLQNHGVSEPSKPLLRDGNGSSKRI